MKYKKYIYFFLPGFLTLFFTSPVQADTCLTNVCPQTLLDAVPIIPKIILLILVMAVFVLFIVILINGIKFMTATGNPEKLSGAQKSFFFTIIGFACIFLAFVGINVLLSVTKTNSGVKVGSNGTLSIDLQSTYSVTPIPSYLLDRVTDTPIPSYENTGSGSGLGYPAIAQLDDGCNIQFDGDIPVFYQYIQTNEGNLGGYYTNIHGGYTGSASEDGFSPSQLNSQCQLWGEYANTHDNIGNADIVGEAWEGSTCSAGSITTVVDSYLRSKGYQGPYLTINDAINFMSPKYMQFDGYQIGAVGLPGFADVANGLAALTTSKTHPIPAVSFQPINASTMIKNDPTEANWTKVLTAANSGFPIIISIEGDAVGPDRTNFTWGHYLTVLKYASGNVTVADTGPLTGLKRLGGGGHFNADGTQTMSASVLYEWWSGSAVLVQPEGEHGSF